MKKVCLTFLLLFTLVAAAQVAHIKAPAIASNGQGVLTGLEVEVREGRGRVLVNTEPLIGVDTQNSENLAVRVAQNYTEADLSEKDVIFTFHANVSLVDGPSAGAAMGAATIAAIQGEKINQNVVLTGTLSEDGRIGTVGGVLKKIKAAADHGVETFLVPQGQKTITEYVTRVSNPSPGVYVKTEEPITIDLSTYAEQWGMNVVEVSHIEQTLPYLIGNASLPTRKLEITPLTPVDGKEKMKELAEFEISRGAEAGVNLTQARSLLEKGYYYSAANDAFQRIIRTPPGASVEDLRFRVRTHLERVESRLDSINRTFYYQKDMEWLAAAEQRYIQALNQVESSNKADLAAAEEWLALAEFSLDRLTFTGDVIDANQVKVKLASVMNEASRKSMVSQALGNGGAKNSLDLAVKASEEGYNLGALNLATDAISAGKSSSMDPFLRLNDYLGQSVQGDWANSYLHHAKYLKWESGGSASSVLSSALYYAVRAEQYSTLYTFASMPTMQTPETEETTEKPSDYDNKVLLALVGAYLLSLFAVYESRKRKHNKAFKNKIKELKEEIKDI